MALTNQPSLIIAPQAVNWIDPFSSSGIPGGRLGVAPSRPGSPSWLCHRDTHSREPQSASARRRYCDDACRAKAYRDRQVAERIWGLGLMLGEAEWNGDADMIRLLTCPVRGRPADQDG